MNKFRAWVLIVFCAALAGTPGASTAAPAGNFEALTGPQTQRLFERLKEISYPNADGECCRNLWTITLEAGGAWDGVAYEIRGTPEAFGSWRVVDDRQCITIKNSYAYHGADPQEGCFRVLVDWSTGSVVGAFPDLKLDRFELAELALDEIARIRQSPPPPLAAAPVVAAPAVTAKKPPTAAPQIAKPNGGQKRALENQRLALESQRLESKSRLQQLKLESDGKIKQLQLELELERLRQQRASAPDQQQPAPTKQIYADVEFGEYFALVIGINDYATLPKLKTAVADARTVAETLRQLYGFSVTLLINPSRDEILDAFDELRDTLSEEDNLLIYYAGHGWLDQQTGVGYWLPVNAKVDRRSRWVSNATLTNTLQSLLAKHVTIVADSCYSGTLTRAIKVPERNPGYLRRMAEKRARVVLSSGGLEPVVDSGGGKHSVFAAQFLKALSGNENVLDGTQLFEQVRQNVILNADQTPEYSDIRKAGHEGGDFLFVRQDR